MTQSKIEKLPKLSSTEATRIEKVLEEKNAVEMLNRRNTYPLSSANADPKFVLPTYRL